MSKAMLTFSSELFHLPYFIFFPNHYLCTISSNTVPSLPQVENDLTPEPFLVGGEMP